MSLYRHESGRGRPLVLLHGWGMNAAIWEPLLPGLTERFRVTVIELPGHGESPAAIAADLSEWARLCVSVAPARALWAGWSLGGQVALRVALDNPARVDGLCLVATTPRFVQAPDWPCAMPPETFRQFADALERDPEGTLLRFLALQVKGAEHERETLRLLRDEIAQRPPADRRGLKQGLDLLLRTDLRHELRSLKHRSCWLLGTRDALVPRSLPGRLGDLVPNARIMPLEGAGHAPFLSHPQAVLAALTEAAAAA